MPGRRGKRVTQKVRGGGHVTVAGRDVNIYYGQGSPDAAATVVPGLLPRDVSRFSGREKDLARLARLPKDDRVVVVTISGTAGVGKTVLAVHAAHRLLPQFPGGQLYADLRGFAAAGQVALDPGEVLGVFLRRLGVSAEEIPAATEERSGMLRGLLASRKVLMLLDNAASEAQIRPLLPGTGTSLVLITSRRELAALDTDERISLDALRNEDAADLLGGLLGADRAAAEPEAVARVLDWCGGLPLALRIAGQLLAVHPSWRVAQLAQLLADERERLTNLAAGDMHVRAAFEVSYRQLADADARMFRLLGLHAGPDFGPGAAAALAGTDPKTANRALARLTESSLLTEGSAGRFGMHDLLRLFARDTCRDADDQEARAAAETRMVRWYATLASVMRSRAVDAQRRTAAVHGERAGESRLSFRQAWELFETERVNLIATIGLAAAQGQDDLVLQIDESVGEMLTLRRYYDDLRVTREAALAAAKRAGNVVAQGRVSNDLGRLYLMLRRFEDAITCCERALEIGRETADRPREAAALNTLGNVYRELRQFEDAVTCYEQSLTIGRENGDRQGESAVLNNLANVYQDVRRFEDAVTCYQQSLAIQRDTGDRHGQGQTLIGLGSAYWELRRFEDAIRSHEQGLAILRETGDRHAEGAALTNLGNAYRELRRFEDAIRSHEQSLAVWVETGDRHAEGAALMNLGVDYRELGRFEDAIRFHEQGLAILREAGHRHAEAMTLFGLGDIQVELGRPGDAFTLYEQARAIFAETSDRHGEGQVLGNLGNIYGMQGHFEDAINCWEQARTFFRETGDRRGEGMTLTNLGLAYQELRKSAKAVECWREATTIMLEVGDSEEAARIEQLAAAAQSKPWWRRRLPADFGSGRTPWNGTGSIATDTFDQGAFPDQPHADITRRPPACRLREAGAGDQTPRRECRSSVSRVATGRAASILSSERS